MAPNRTVRKLIGGIVARYQEIFDIEIYALKYLSNHPHLLIRAKRGNADEFLENVNREVARRINWKNNRKGKFWARRYTDQKVLSEPDLLEAFLYITTNGVRHGLVEHPSLWPGLSSYEQSLTEKEERYIFQHFSARQGQPQVTEHTLKISPLPQFAELSPKKRKKLVRKLIEERTNALVKARKEEGRGFLGVQAVQSQDPDAKPREVSNKKRGLSYSKNPILIREHLLGARQKRRLYDYASMRFRAGELSVIFPDHTFKPPLHRRPRLFPFEPLPDDFFKNAA